MPVRSEYKRHRASLIAPCIDAPHAKLYSYCKVKPESERIVKDMLSVAQFAALHGINKRTLHYYDDIGLFSPHTRQRTDTATTRNGRTSNSNTS